MIFDYLQLYVPDIATIGDRLEKAWGFTLLGSNGTPDTLTRLYQQGHIRLFLSTPLNPESPVQSYLDRHPPGIATLAFQAENYDHFCQTLNQETIQYEDILHPLTGAEGVLFAAWGDVEHAVFPSALIPNAAAPFGLTKIDHVVINVSAGAFPTVSRWYQALFGWRVQQRFTISTPHSGLYSEALIDPLSGVQFNLNHPTTDSSQIQTFLDRNGATGIQHVAFATTDITQTVQQLQHHHVNFVPVPDAYYQQLASRSPAVDDLSTLQRLGILLDMNGDRSDQYLQQTFTQPLFGKGTWFWEIIQRHQQAKGFGEGNFQALYEAVEAQEQLADQQPATEGEFLPS